MNLLLTVTAPGKPRPQGSMQLSRDPRTGKEFAKYASETVNHRNYVIGRIHEAWGGRPALQGAIGVQCEFRFARPQSHYGTGKNAGVLKASAPKWMLSAPDNDKLLRLVNDALTIAGVIVDDRLVVVCHGEKIWAEKPETLIEVWEMQA